MTKTILVCCVQLCFVVFCFAACPAESKDTNPRSKLSGEFGLAKFLRVGRTPERIWDSSTSEVKRRVGKMVSFPRIGRSDKALFHLREDADYDKNNYEVKRPSSSETNGVWFGPRLGRLQKRNSEDFAPWTYIIINGEGLVPRQVHYTPRLGRESEETYDSTNDNVDA